MSFLDAGKVAAAQIGFSTLFNQFFSIINEERDFVDTGGMIRAGFYRQLATVVPSDHRIQQHNWLGALPQFTEWVGERKIDKARNYNYQIVNKKWANGFEVDQDDIDDDALGLYQPRINQLAQMAAVHRTNLLIDMLIQGFATTTYGAGYDGQAFFSATHKDGNGPTQSNTSALALSTAGTLDTWIQTMMSFKGEDGEPLGLSPTHLIVGPLNRAEARKQTLMAFLGSGASNPNYGVVQPVVTAKITDGKCFLVDLSAPVRPVILQIRREVTFDFVDVLQSMEKFLRDKLYFGAHARYNGGYGLWQMAVGTSSAT